MGFRFRRSVRVLPGVRLNVSTRGVSASIGGRGATVNISRRGARATVGIPGTGLSYSTPLSGPAAKGSAQSFASGPAAAPAGSPVLGWIALGILLLALAMCMAGRSSTPAGPSTAASPTAPTSAAASSRTVAGSSVNCRAAPSKSGVVLAKLGKGDVVRVTEHAPEWTKVAQPGGDCWVANRLLAD